ncbi:MAG: DUF7144 family membrane protein [bacterium JZ-2024 1]
MTKPAGIWVVSILLWMGGFLGVIGGLRGLFGAGALGVSGAMPRLGAVVGFFSVIALIVAVLELFVGWGIFTLKTWARTAGIVLAGLGLLLSLTRFNLLPIVISAVILYFLLFDRATADAFASSR